MKLSPPYFPIIYVRGYAMTEGEIKDTVATPYMGFNSGAAKVRQDWEGRVKRHIFESPLIRLMKDYGYTDNYDAGNVAKGQLPARSVLIHRYYDVGDPDLGAGKTPTVEEAAEGLRALIEQTRRQVCGEDPEALGSFKVYLVAHSMGGLICRCLLQNDRFANAPERGLVDKVFTYATPHDGIEMAGMNVPKWLGFWDIDNFNRKRIAKYLSLSGSPKRVNTLDGKFDPQRFFCLVGTNHKDYTVAGGASSALAGDLSDGLVQITAAAVDDAPRAFVYRSHSGHYGIVNSEEGYQNLVRFLFGDARVLGKMETQALPLPPEVQQALDADKEVRASYYFESTVSPRGALTFKLDEKRKESHSAILRKYDELFPKKARTKPRWPFLFSAFLDSAKVPVGENMLFTIELSVSSTGYEIDGFLWMDRDIPGETLFRDTLFIRADRRKDGWDLFYNLDSKHWAKTRATRVSQDKDGYFVPLSSEKGFEAKLRLVFDSWR